MVTVATIAPIGYTAPSFPSLYWPINADPGDARYLYRTTEIWRFTLYWTFITYAAVYLATGLYAVVMQPKNWRLVWIVPVFYLLMGCIESLMAGSLVGLVLGAVYQAGYFHMSTWIPFIWAFVNVLVLILSSFSIQGGL